MTKTDIQPGIMEDRTANRSLISAAVVLKEAKALAAYYETRCLTLSHVIEEQQREMAALAAENDRLRNPMEPFNGK